MIFALCPGNLKISCQFQNGLLKTFLKPSFPIPVFTILTFYLVQVTVLVLSSQSSLLFIYSVHIGVKFRQNVLNY